MMISNFINRATDRYRRWRTVKIDKGIPSRDPTLKRYSAWVQLRDVKTKAIAKLWLNEEDLIDLLRGVPYPLLYLMLHRRTPKAVEDGDYGRAIELWSEEGDEDSGCN